MIHAKKKKSESSLYLILCYTFYLCQSTPLWGEGIAGSTPRGKKIHEPNIIFSLLYHTRAKCCQVQSNDGWVECVLKDKGENLINKRKLVMNDLSSSRLNNLPLCATWPKKSGYLWTIWYVDFVMIFQLTAAVAICFLLVGSVSV